MRDNILIDMSSKGIEAPEEKIVLIDNFLELNYVIEVKRIFNIINQYSRIFVYNMSDYLYSLESKEIVSRSEVKENLLYGLLIKENIDALWENMNISNLLFDVNDVPYKTTAVFTQNSKYLAESVLTADPTFISKDDKYLERIFNEFIVVDRDILDKDDFCEIVGVDDIEFLRIKP